MCGLEIVKVDVYFREKLLKLSGKAKEQRELTEARGVLGCSSGRTAAGSSARTELRRASGWE